MVLAARLPTGPLAAAARASQATRAAWAAPQPAAAAARWAAALPRWQRRRQARLAAAAPDAGSPSSSNEGEEGGLLPEEDFEVPGTYRDAMTTNTPLGKAVKGACDELDALGSLERQTLEEAEGLLKKLGFKGSLFAAPQQPQQGAEQQAAEQPGGDGGAQ